MLIGYATTQEDMTSKTNGSQAAPESEWFEVSDRDWLGPGFKGKKIKIVADAMVPNGVVAEIAGAGISIEVMDRAVRHQSDPAVLNFAHRRGRVLLTLDRDFWDDKKYPLQSVRTGIIYIAEPPDSPDLILRAFGLVYGCFAKSYPLDWWHQMKVKAHVGEFEIKMRTWQGRISRYRLRLRRGFVEAKELEA